MHYNRKMTSTPFHSTLFSLAYPAHSEAFNTLVFDDIKLALHEDVGANIAEDDLTAQLIPAQQTTMARVITREHAVICGIPWATAAFLQCDNQLHITWLVGEGDVVQPNQLLCEITGNARALLTAERCALNFLQLLSAVATQTRQYVDVIKHTQAQILDTRKTIPGLRLAQKYAVAIGGGQNQRLALYDGILIKENHIVAAGSIKAAMQAAIKLAHYHSIKKDSSKKISVQIEVETLVQLNEALIAGAKSVLLDNFDLILLGEAVKLNQTFALQNNEVAALLEASGGVDLNTVKAIAETGVDRISVGSLTKNIRAIDLSMRITSSA